METLSVIRKNAYTAFSPRPQSVTVTTKRLDEVLSVNNPKRNDNRHLSKSSSSTKEPIPSNSVTAKLSSKKSQPEAPKSSAKVQMSSSTGHVYPTSSSVVTGISSKAVRESNYTPSISSIGSVLLRSKTADFEKILSDQKKKSRISPTASVQKSSHNVHSSSAKVQQPPNVTNINISLKAASKKKSDDSENRMPIYKRQEIISSVQKT